MNDKTTIKDSDVLVWSAVQVAELPLPVKNKKEKKNKRRRGKEEEGVWHIFNR